MLNQKSAYRCLAAEVEAFENENDLIYIDTRKKRN